MSEWKKQAVAKLREEQKARFDRQGEVMKYQLCEYLERLCDNDEFAQAVVQGGTLGEAMKAVATEIKNGGISDQDAVRRAAEFYFHGAVVHFDVRLELAGDPPAGAESGPAPGILSLSDFF